MLTSPGHLSVVKPREGLEFIKSPWGKQILSTLTCNWQHRTLLYSLQPPNTVGSFVTTEACTAIHLPTTEWGRSARPGAGGLSCPRSVRAPRRLRLCTAKTKPAGAAPRRPEPDILPRYVQRLGNSSLDTAVTETVPRPLPLSRCSEWGKLGVEADPGATCWPTHLGDRRVKEQSCFAIQPALLCLLPLNPTLVFQLQPDF
ncbi:hypothetical protein PAL_GLEAN10018833 [Pteropus alecto]|uniref:Uncharacterized protein n=1 Tax=Pteropus alecto TaxID=9402 RepID=L5L2Q5_PTEAL|nr:hypothetical protein PAL_GLEAN10018833 [Pteropus alecto]